MLPTYRGDTQIQCADWLNCHVSQVKEHVSLELIKAVIAMREVKSELEIAEMERAANTAYYMHTTAMKMCKPGMVEQEIAGVVEGLSLSGGGPVSFPVILSVDGQTLHNHGHHNVLKEGRMMVCDAGAETENYYASDFTRTMRIPERPLDNASQFALTPAPSGETTPKPVTTTRRILKSFI